MIFAYLVAALLFVGVLYILFKSTICYWNFRRRAKLINKLPGPKAFPVVGNAHLFSFDSYKNTFLMERLFHEFSDGLNNSGLFRIWVGPVPLVFCCRAISVTDILANSSEITKPKEGYTRLQEWLGKGLLTSGGDQWRSQRKMLTPTFHFSILNNFMPIFNKQAQLFASKLDTYATQQDEVDIFPMMKLCSLDVICETAMGISLNAQSGHSKEYVTAVKVVCEQVWDRERLPWLWNGLFWKISGREKIYQKALRTVHHFTRQVIDDRKTSNKAIPDGKLAFLDLLLKMQQENEIGFSDEYIQAEVDTFMFEGHDTVASALGFTVFALGHHKDIQQKLFEEVDGVIGNDEFISNEHLANMKYLEQVIKEGLRVFPPVPMIARQLINDLEIAENTIPSGTTVLVVPFGTHRDPKYFPDPEIFDPSRFETEKCADRSPFAFIPFSAGMRNCIGQKFGMLELKVMLATLIRKYEFTSCISIVENRGLPELILRPSRGVPVKIRKR